MSGVGDLSNGKYNVIESLFSTEDLYQYPTYPSYDQDYYNIGNQEDIDYNMNKPTENIPILLSYGLKNAMGIEAGDLIKWEHNYNGTVVYMATVRGLVTKFPGFTFSGLNTIQFSNTALISMDSYKKFRDDISHDVANTTANLIYRTNGA